MPIKTLAQKLYIRPGYTVALLNAPKGAADLLAPLPEEAKTVTNLKGKADLILQFVKTSAELEKAAKELKEKLGDEADGETVLWFAYPKKTSKVANDLTRDHGWKPIYEMGFEGVATVAIDDTWSAIRFKRGLAKSEEDLIVKQYDGPRAAFFPLYEKLVNIFQNLGPDVELLTRQSYVAFSRGKQFGLLKPSRDRLDLILRLTNPPLTARLQSAAGMGSGSMSHRVAITKSEDIDRQVISWIQDAYRAATK
jgi:predicted transport protein